MMHQMMMRVVVPLCALAGIASAAPKPPCKGCTLEAPASSDPVPLLVVLHGDREHAANAAARWRSVTKQRGWALLAIECPKARGCKDSFWQWDGDPSWILDQVSTVAKQIKVDPQQVFLAGWSGGATYIGWHVQAWPGTFAAVVVHGGGAAPSDRTCVDLPAYFLVGDKNPLHYLARQLHEYFDDCKQTVMWDLISGADHAKEASALTKKKALEILSWLASHARRS